MQMSESFALLSEQNKTSQKQNELLIRQTEDLKEQLAILTQHRFGRKTESEKQVLGQLSFSLENMCVLNEVEVLTENGIPEEPEFEKVIIRQKRAKGKRNLNLKDIEVKIVQHDCTQEELQAHFPKGWHVLEDEVYKELQYIPSCFKVLEHHVKVYAGNHDSGSFLRAKAPNRLLAHSILTPELAAAVFNAKYVNAIPLNRLSEEFLRNDVNIPRQDMAGWMIRKHSWHIIDSVKGAKANALLYSIAESAKANSLKPYEYFKHLLTELVKHPRGNVPEEVLASLMPWSESLPDCSRKTKSR